MDYETQKEIAIWFGYIMSGIFILSMIIGVVCLTTIIFRRCVKVFKANKSTIALCGFLLLAILLLVLFVLGLHICQVIRSVDETKLQNYWLDYEGNRITLRDMIIGYTGHLNLHLEQIHELIEQ